MYVGSKGDWFPGKVLTDLGDIGIGVKAFAYYPPQLYPAFMFEQGLHELERYPVGSFIEAGEDYIPEGDERDYASFIRLYQPGNVDR